jgi:conjugal transfer pilus assembly protein TraF
MYFLRLLTASLIGGFSFNSLAEEPSTNTDVPKSSYYQDRERGWFWFEDPITETVEKENPQEAAIPKSTPEEKDENVRIDVAWLRAKIPEYQEAAINNPTRENIARFMYAQRYMLDLSSRFSTKTMEFMQFESALDETKRRPISTFSLNAFKTDVQQNIRSVIAKVSNQTHIWFFYSSDCSYCVKQIPVIREASVRFNLDVLAISMDGGRLPGMESFEHVVDKTGVAERFGVQYTPTTFLAFDGDKGFAKLGEGMTDLPTIQDRILLSARMNSVISDEEYQATRDVREINVLEKDGVMYANKKLLDEDPGYLAEILRRRLSASSPSTGVLLNEATENE